MSLSRFLSELKQRNVVRVAGVYTVTAWALFQIVKTVFETFDFPKWTQQLALTLLMLGLPIAVIVAWAFERTADGKIKRTETLPDDAPKPKFGWLDGAIVGGMLLVLVFAGLQVAGVVSRAGGGEATVLGVGAPQKSVAVLPFVSFSTLKETEYFADGLTEEVINSLAQLPDLKVAGRTSAFYFKGKNEDLREVGRRLGVAHVVEGSVRREGDRLRVTAQLIEVRTGFNVWSKTYDKTMDDALAIQTEIANAVAEALKAKLVSGGKRPKARDPEAYRLELTARGLVRQMGLAPITEARDMFRRLMRMEPDNAEAHAGYAYASALLAQNYLQGDFTPTVREAEAAVARALKLNPKSASAYIAKGMLCRIQFVRASKQSCEATAEADFRKAVELEPRNPEALALLGYLIADRRPAEAMGYLDRALAIDPLDRLSQIARANTLAVTGRFAEAEQQYRAAAELFPDFVDAKQGLGSVLAAQGRLNEAEPWLRMAAQPGTDPAATLQLAQLYLNLGMPDRARASVEAIDAIPGFEPLARAVKMMLANDFRGLQALSEGELRRPDPDPIWRSGLFLGAMFQGDYELARQQMLILSPELFRPKPEVSPDHATDALDGAFVIGELGDRAQARRIVEVVLAVTAPQAGLRQTNANRVARIKAYAMLGDKEKALAELRTAIDNGYRQYYDLDYLLRIDVYPMMAALRADPRFRAMIAEIETDNARMRQALLARTAPPS